jgi:hypothetical protein
MNTQKKNNYPSFYNIHGCIFLRCNVFNNCIVSSLGVA